MTKSSHHTKRILVVLFCLMGVSLLAGCSEEPKKAEATPAPVAAVPPGGGPQQQTLNTNGPVAGPGASSGSLRSLRGK